MTEALAYSGILKITEEDLKYMETPNKGRRSPRDWELV